MTEREKERARALWDRYGHKWKPEDGPSFTVPDYIPTDPIVAYPPPNAAVEYTVKTMTFSRGRNDAVMCNGERI